MSLKTDYKNDVFQGKRKYRPTTNSDNTLTLDDITVYQVQGDIFSAADINATNKAVNKNEADISSVNAKTSNLEIGLNEVKRVLTATCLASRWSTSAPYMQTVTVQGVKSTDAPIYGLFLGDNPTPVTADARKKAFRYVDRLTTANNAVTLYCYKTRPTADFVIQIKGV